MVSQNFAIGFACLPVNRKFTLPYHFSPFHCVSSEKWSGTIARFWFKRIILVILFCISVSPLWAQMRQDWPLEKDWRVNKVIVQGVKKFLPFEVKTHLETKEGNWWPWSKVRYFDSDTLEQDIEKIIAFYEDNGYYDTRIDVDFQILTKKRINIILQVEEGYHFRVSKIDIFDDAGIEPEVKKLLYQNMTIMENRLFSYKNYEESKKIALSTLADYGYYGAEMSGKVFLDRNTRTAKVEYTLSSGPLQKFGTVNVKGTQKVRVGLITRELLFRSGDTFSASKMYESQRRIFDLGFFRSVVLEPVARPGFPSVLDIRIEVEERPFYSLKIGPGYGPEDRARMQAFWRLFNFGRLGGNLEINSKLAVRHHLTEANFTQPYFGDRYTNFIGGVGYEKSFFDYYHQETLSGRARLARSVTNQFNVFCGYQAERDLLFLLDPNRAFDEDIGFAKRYVLSFLDVGFQHKTTEDLFYPKEGQVNSFTWEFTPKYIGSSVSYLRGLWEYKYFYPVKQQIILAWRNQFGYARPILDTPSIPVFKKFFSGGSYSVRGYGYRALGPKDEKDNPIGGNSQWEGNIELRFPLYRDFGGVLFYDYGEVIARTKSYTLADLRTTAGFGLRYGTPIGPLRADYGYKLKPFEGAERYKIYISIGQAF